MRTTHTLWPLACVLLLFVGCASPQHQDNSAEARTGIDATNAELMTGVNEGNAAAVATLFTDEAQQFPPNGEIVRGRAAIQKRIQDLIDGGFNLQLEAVEVEGHGDTAYEIGKYAVTKDGATVDEGKYIVIWKKVDGNWKLHRDIFNSNQPLPETAAPADEAAM